VILFAISAYAILERRARDARGPAGRASVSREAATPEGDPRPEAPPA